MGESWKDKTVSLGNVDKEVFDSELAHITVSENQITVEFRDVEDWKRIKREIGEETILKQVPWEDIEEVEANVEHLYYPHIDIETDEGTKRLYFHEDEEELLQDCFNTIKEFRMAVRESGPRSQDTYSYEDGEQDGEIDTEEGEEAELEPETEDDEEDTEEDGPDEETVRDLVEDFMGR